MLATRLRMLSVFAGGCLSGSVLIVFWRGDAEPSAPSTRRAETPSAPVVAIALDDGQHAADGEASPHEEGAPTPSLPSAPKTAEPSADATEPGRAITDVLAHLEAAYREKLAEAPPSSDPPSRAALTEPPATATLAQAPAPEAPAREPSSAAVVAVAAPAVPAAPALVAPPIAYAPPPAAPVATPVAAAQNPAPATANPAVAAVAPPVGVVPQNVHIGDTHNGNTYNVQQVIQYVPMYNPWAYGGYGGYVPPAAPTPRGAGQKRVPYPSTLTNPDNPWGYDFPSALWTVR